jgi:site-specific DNA-cytosine methylase
MGVCEEYIDLIQAAGISRSQQYKMAGNSIVVNVLVAIFRQLLIGNKNAFQQLEIF